MKIVGFNGSLSRDSNSLKGLQIALKSVAEENVEVLLYDLKENPLPIYEPDRDYSNYNIEYFSRVLSEADGVILASPEYHNTVGGAFKNAMDWVGTTHFKNKPVALISATGGPSSMATLTAMQLMMRSLHAWVVPVLGSIPGNVKFNKNGDFEDINMQKRFLIIGKEMVRATRLLKSQR